MDNSLFQKNRHRDQYIDALKGAAILLVVIGHSIQENIPNFDNNVVFRVIYSFHMPLFMFLSGYILFGHIKNPLHIWIFDKFKRLVLPFLGWAFIYKILRHNSESFTQYFINLFEHPDLGLWFLWILFLNCCILSIILLSDKAFKGAKLILIIILYSIPIDVFGLFWLKWLFPFFAIGYTINEYKTEISGLIKNSSIFLAMSFPILVYFWHRTEEPGFNSIIYEFSYMVPYIRLIDVGYKYLVAFAGISFVALIIKKLERYNISLLSWLGTCTLDIYVSHQLFLWGIGEGIFRIISTIVISLLLSLMLSFCLRQSKILSMILLGRNIKKVRNNNLKLNSIHTLET